MKNVRTATLLTVTLLAAAIIVAGCGKGAEEAPASAPAPAEPAHMEPGEHGGHDEHGASVAPSATPSQTAGAQTKCPVMGLPIDKSAFVDHDGKRVYFCCPNCVATFKADPEKYLSKMSGQGIQLEASPEL